jgi:transcriptional regulator with XRE-family HTH domain
MPDPVDQRAALAFGQVLREFRSASGLTQARLAELSNLDRTYISLLERGQRQPSLGTMLTLARCFRTRLVALSEAVERSLSQLDASSDR